MADCKPVRNRLILPLLRQYPKNRIRKITRAGDSQSGRNSLLSMK
jgi:hypothetical protein